MTIDVDHLVAIGVVARVGSADVRAITRHLLEAGVRIGTEEHLARRMAARIARAVCRDLPSDWGGERP